MTSLVFFCSKPRFTRVRAQTRKNKPFYLAHMSNFRPVLAFLLWIGVIPCWGQHTMPIEEFTHEGTWLQWPHNFTYGSGAEDVESSWVQMTAALTPGERVHIIAYNEYEAAHITELLENAEIDLGQVDFLLCPTDDFWIRDNGPIFVQGDDDEWVILDWGFNGWGEDAPYALDDAVPLAVAVDLDIPVIDLSAVVLEGGAIEVDGQGTLMATRSSITGEDRNPGLSEGEIEVYFNTYLGIEQVIWLDGQYGGNEDITDQHIDGFVKFVGGNTLVTMDDADLAYWYVSSADRNIIDEASNTDGIPFTRVNLPLTQFPVQTTWGQSIGFRSTYVNYYVGNSVVLVPEYDDPMDAVALDIVQGLYPERSAVGINCQNMLQWGGMVHCVTQQQPMGATSLSLQRPERFESQGNAMGTFDIMGRAVQTIEAGRLYIKRYENGTSKTVFIWE